MAERQRGDEGRDCGRRMPWTGRTRRRKAALALAVLALTLTSCAPRLRYAGGVDPLSFLSPNLDFYLSSSRAETLVLAEHFADAGRQAFALEAAARVERLALGAGDDGRFEAAAYGSFPAGRADALLAADPGWKREGEGWRETGGALRVAFADSRLALASNRPLALMTPRLLEPGPSPLPAAASDLSGGDLLVIVPDAYTVLSGLAGAAEEAGAARFTLATAWYVDGAGSRETRAAFVFPDGRSARVYEAVARLALYGAVRALFDPVAGDALLEGAAWTREGALVRVRLPPVDDAAWRGALGRLAATFRASEVRSD
ncbi:MAG TPA: hypothetical protein PKW82_03315 [Spirochaetales bacterium]|nr:hypothetical protein [Spirochaetales bacterium]